MRSIVWIGLTMAAGLALLGFALSQSPGDAYMPSWAPPSSDAVADQLDGFTFDQFIDVSYEQYLLRFPEVLTFLDPNQLKACWAKELQARGLLAVTLNQALHPELQTRRSSYQQSHRAISPWACPCRGLRVLRLSEEQDCRQIAHVAALQQT